MTTGNGKNGKDPHLARAPRPIRREEADSGPSTQPSERGDVEHQLDGIGLSLMSVDQKADTAITELRILSKEHEAFSRTLDEQARGLDQLRDGQTRTHEAIADLRVGQESMTASMLTMTAQLSDVARTTRETKALAEKADRSSQTNEIDMAFLKGGKMESWRSKAQLRDVVAKGLKFVGTEAKKVVRPAFYLLLLWIAREVAVAKGLM